MMIMMVVFMTLPVVALPVFFLLPLGESIPVYVVCCLLSAAIYWLMMKNMKRPVKTGAESLVGKETMVLSRSTSDKVTPYQVKVEGEIWGAGSRDSLETGEKVVIVSVEGNKIIIKRKDNNKET